MFSAIITPLHTTCRLQQQQQQQQESKYVSVGTSVGESLARQNPTTAAIVRASPVTTPRHQQQQQQQQQLATAAAAQSKQPLLTPSSNSNSNSSSSKLSVHDLAAALPPSAFRGESRGGREDKGNGSAAIGYVLSTHSLHNSSLHHTVILCMYATVCAALSVGVSNYTASRSQSLLCTHLNRLI
jgi:hypothetical protein